MEGIERPVGGRWRYQGSVSFGDHEIGPSGTEGREVAGVLWEGGGGVVSYRRRNALVHASEESTIVRTAPSIILHAIHTKQHHPRTTRAKGRFVHAHMSEPLGPPTVR